MEVVYNGESGRGAIARKYPLPGDARSPLVCFYYRVSIEAGSDRAESGAACLLGTAPGGAVMKGLAEKIRAARSLEDVLPLIETLSRETTQVIAKGDLTESDVDRILHPIEVMRMLLGKLDLVLSGASDDPQTVAIRDLAARCLDLEGKLKETRNDRLRPKFAA